MKAKMVLAATVLIFIAATCWAGSGPDLTPGKWEITVEIEMPGMPMKMPPTVHTQCLTDDNPVPQNNQPGQQCKMDNVRTSGNTVSWTMTCDSSVGKMTGEGKVTYHKDRLEGTMVMKSEQMNFTNNFKGHRVGDCQ